MYHGELVWGGRHAIAPNLSLTDRQPLPAACLLRRKPGTATRFREMKTGEKEVVTALLLLTGGRPPTGQTPPWQAVYTQARRPRVLVEPCESLGIRSCCEVNGNQWKSGWVGHRQACWLAGSSSHQLAGAGAGQAGGGGTRRQVNSPSFDYAQSAAVNQLPAKLSQLYCCNSAGGGFKPS